MNVSDERSGQKRDGRERSVEREQSGERVSQKLSAKRQIGCSVVRSLKAH